MGLILDTSILIASERNGGSIEAMLEDIKAKYGEIDTALSAVSVVELTHGVFRAKTPAMRELRRIFTGEVVQELIVHPLTLEIAQLAGRIEGEQAARGFVIGFEDLVIGATALHLGYDVLTLNPRHFRLIPGLQVQTL